MKLLKLEILNLASLDRDGGEVVCFEQGALGQSNIFSIVGPTGSGKSTLLDAICLALFNKAPRYPRKKNDHKQRIQIYGQGDADEDNRLAPTDCRNILTRGKKNGYSKLTFAANDGTVYRAEWHVRFLRKKYDKAETALFRLGVSEGRVVEQADDWQRLPQIVGLDYEQFLRTVVIAQGSFAQFLTATEEQRYELLEKLVGCEDTYKRIAEGIGRKKDEADKAFMEIKSKFEAVEKDDLTPEELEDLKQRINALKAEAERDKQELDALKKAIAWFDEDEKMRKDIDKNKEQLDKAQAAAEAMAPEATRLALHDATTEAVNLYKDFISRGEAAEQLQRDIKQLTDDINRREEDIQQQRAQLASLKTAAEEAATTLETQKPHINAARTIMVEWKTAKKVLGEKQLAAQLADEAVKKAQRAVDNNAKAIGKAENDYKSACTNAETLKTESDGQRETKRLAAEKADSDYQTAHKQMEQLDAEALQTDKTRAEAYVNDLKEALRIRRELKGKEDKRQAHQLQKRQLADDYARKQQQLDTLTIGELEKEVETLGQACALISSRDLDKLRHSLVEGQPCPLCGAVGHPYADAATFAPVVSEMEKLLESKRNELTGQRAKAMTLNASLTANKTLLESIAKDETELGRDIQKLTQEWNPLQQRHDDWTADEDALTTLKSWADEQAARANDALQAYNTLNKRVGKLLKAKLDEEKRFQDYCRLAEEQLRAAETKKNKAFTALETERGKTQNLLTQLAERKAALEEANKAVGTAQTNADDWAKALKKEIGDRDPEQYELQLTEAKEKAAKKAADKQDDITRMVQQLQGQRGSLSAKREQRANELLAQDRKKSELTTWKDNYNASHDAPIATDDVAALADATDDWEGMRALLRKLADDCTRARTTLANEQARHEAHQQGMPADRKEALEERKIQIEAKDYSQLVKEQARLTRYNDARRLMGELYDRREEARQWLAEWTAMTNAIGADGKTLRKIAQCYTLGFLVEYANVEIRRFNSRYELVHVKNSLGIRIIDHDRADDVRDITSLSGGETFIVSLGLALALSAVSSRNLSFDNLFIDEGFGTLDPDTLATVIDSLAMLQMSQGKKVGVISHTDTMSERIGTQIRVVKKGNSGSSYLEVYPS